MLLTSGSLVGAISIAIFGWLTLQGLNRATDELEKEAQKSGSSSSEHEDVKAFLDTSRSVFVTMEIYPQNYPGVYSIAYDALTLAREGANKLSDKYHHNYPDEIMLPLSKGIVELENAISEMQKINSLKSNPNLLLFMGSTNDHLITSSYFLFIWSVHRKICELQ